MKQFDSYPEMSTSMLLSFSEGKVAVASLDLDVPGSFVDLWRNVSNFWFLLSVRTILCAYVFVTSPGKEIAELYTHRNYYKVRK